MTEGSLVKDHRALNCAKKAQKPTFANPYTQIPVRALNESEKVPGKKGKKDIHYSLFAPILAPIIVPCRRGGRGTRVGTGVEPRLEDGSR